jgi:hypothetical protein
MNCVTLTLALAVWYLMTPPPLVDSKSQAVSKTLVDADRPLREWERKRSFETAGACQAYRKDQIIEAHEEAEKAPKPVVAPLLLELNARYHSRCIAGNDPSLQSK